MNPSPYALRISTSRQRSDMIDRAQKSILYCAPGITALELKALVNAYSRLANGAVRLFVDFQSDAVKNGWWGDCSPEDLSVLLELDPPPQIAKHWRLGLLVVDDEAIIFAPAPQTLEAERGDSTEPNALWFDTIETKRLLDSVTVPKDQAPKRPIVSSDQVKEIQKELAETLSLKPSQHRVLDVLRKRVKIIQFEVRGYQLDRRKLQLPEQVIKVLGSERQDINERLAASWKLFKADANQERTTSNQQKEFEKQLDELKDKYLVRLKHYGFGLVESARAEFEKAWEDFENQKVMQYRAAVQERVGGMIENSRNLLRQLLMERAAAGRLELPPIKTLFPQSKEEREKEYIENLIASVGWPEPDEVATDVVVKRREYDITESLLRDEEFIELLEKTLKFKLEDLQETAQEQVQPTMVPSMIPFSLN